MSLLVTFYQCNSYLFLSDLDINNNYNFYYLNWNSLETVAFWHGIFCNVLIPSEFESPSSNFKHSREKKVIIFPYYVPLTCQKPLMVNWMIIVYLACLTSFRSFPNLQMNWLVSVIFLLKGGLFQHLSITPELEVLYLTEPGTTVF